MGDRETDEARETGEPAMGAWMRRMHLRALDEVEGALPLVLKNTDPAPLHVVRVALRRSRSGLALVRGAFSEAGEARFRRELGRFQRATNKLRDLDVFLAGRAEFAALLPDSLQAGLEGLFLQLETERAAVFEAGAAYLGGVGVRGLLLEWRAFLEDTSDPASAPKADRPALPWAKKLLSRRFQRILRDGGKIGPDTPVAALHALRIQVKKLRYLLEFFGELLPASETAAFLRRFRKLQNVLGRLNDLAVQAQWFEQRLRAETRRARPTVSVPATAALGGLLTALAREETAQRTRFAKAFAKLGNRSARERAGRLFG